MNIELKEQEKINGCIALQLAVEGWLSLFHSGTASDTIVLSWDQSVIWVEADGEPVAVLLWTYQDFRREVWISLSYTRPGFRRNGYFRRMYNRVLEIAKEKKATRVAGGIRPGNDAMMAAAVRCGRSLEFVVYSQEIKGA